MHQRIHPMTGVRNFRDFGGYATREGGEVKMGRLFRSGHFNLAEDSDIDAIEALNIRLQVDLRRPDERERMPGRWPREGVRIINHDGGREMEAPHQRFLKQTAVSADVAHNWMDEYYQKAPFRPHHIDMFRDWFDGLAILEADEAALVNCAAGKDRTGILCGLTLTALGVDEDTVFDDYELTNEAAKVAERLPEAAAYFNEQIGQSHPAEVYKPFVGVHRSFLVTAWRVIREEHGSIEGYMDTVLGVDASARDKLRAKLVA